jgi:hypothetical protein
VGGWPINYGMACVCVSLRGCMRACACVNPDEPDLSTNRNVLLVSRDKSEWTLWHRNNRRIFIQ